MVMVTAIIVINRPIFWYCNATKQYALYAAPKMYTIVFLILGSASASPKKDT